MKGIELLHILNQAEDMVASLDPDIVKFKETVQILAGPVIAEYYQQEMDDAIARSTGEHYGMYGAACINTGQFDAGVCWKCKIKRLEDEISKIHDEMMKLAQTRINPPLVAAGQSELDKMVRSLQEDLREAISERDEAREEVARMVEESWADGRVR
jgi:hypothetical protein